MKQIKQSKNGDLIVQYYRYHLFWMYYFASSVIYEPDYIYWLEWKDYNKN